MEEGPPPQQPFLGAQRAAAVRRATGDKGGAGARAVFSQRAWAVPAVLWVWQLMRVTPLVFCLNEGGRA